MSELKDENNFAMDVIKHMYFLFGALQAVSFMDERRLQEPRLSRSASLGITICLIATELVCFHAVFMHNHNLLGWG